MSSRRAFLGAAAAALSLPATVDAEADPDASNPGREEPEYDTPAPSRTASAYVSARTTANSGDGSVTVRSVRFRVEDGPAYEAEIEVAAPPVRLPFALDREATRQLRDTLAGDRREGHVGGRAQLVADGVAGEAAVAVLGDRLQVETSDTEAAVALDEELREEIVAGLDAALAEPSTVEGRRPEGA
jgi:hypothetical protein